MYLTDAIDPRHISSGEPTPRSRQRAHYFQEKLAGGCEPSYVAGKEENRPEVLKISPDSRFVYTRVDRKPKHDRQSCKNGLRYVASQLMGQLLITGFQSYTHCFGVILWRCNLNSITRTRRLILVGRKREVIPSCHSRVSAATRNAGLKKPRCT